MASYSEGGIQQAAYTYNGQGERTSKQLSNGKTIHYLYNAAGQLQGEYHYSNGQLTLRQSYVWLGMMPIAMIKEDLAQQSQQIVYIHSDQLNKPRMATDQSQNTLWQWQSSAFGEELPIENGLTLNLRFPGQYYDAESKTHYNYYRDYDAQRGRYLQSDPIGLKGGMNTYGYVGGNQVRWFDPLGLDQDMNLFSQSSIDYYHNKYMYDNAKNIPSNDNFQISGHGDSQHIYDKDGFPISPSTLMKMAKEKGYQKRQTIELTSCNTESGGVNSFAQFLAQECNCTVVAPDNYIWLNGSLPAIVAGQKNGMVDYSNVGSINIFESGKVPRSYSLI